MTAGVREAIWVTPAPDCVAPVTVLSHPAAPHTRLKEVHSLVTPSLFPVQLHALVDALLESLHHPLSEDEGDHEGDELYQVDAAQAEGILKVIICYCWNQIFSAFCRGPGGQWSVARPWQGED